MRGVKGSGAQAGAEFAPGAENFRAFLLREGEDFFRRAESLYNAGGNPRFVAEDGVERYRADKPQMIFVHFP